jgi:biopolymer transport protein ExbD
MDFSSESGVHSSGFRELHERFPAAMPVTEACQSPPSDLLSWPRGASVQASPVIPSVLPYRKIARLSLLCCLSGVKSIKPDSATLSITADRSVFWKDERMSDEQLAQWLHASAPRHPQPKDFMRGDRQAGLPARRPGDGGCAEVRAC